MMVKIFVGGFPLDMTELELVQMVALHGDVSTIKIVRDKKTKICKGYAFIEMTSLQAAEQVMDALNGTSLKGRELIINIVEEKPAPPPPRTYVKVTHGADRAKRPRKRL
jgi:RNA recognition motif-containing protein